MSKRKQQTLFGFLKNTQLSGDNDSNNSHTKVQRSCTDIKGYVTTIIEDAVLYSSHAKKKSIDIHDVRLAIELQQDKNFASPPSRELTAELARQRNSIPLPTIRSSAGLRLPPDRHSLTGCNFNLKHATKKRKTVHGMNITNLAAHSAISRQINVKPEPGSMMKFPEGNRGIIQTPTAVSVPSVNPHSAAQIFMSNGIQIKEENVNSIKRMNEDDDYDDNN